MPFNGSGVYNFPSLPGSWNPAISGQQATPDDWNTLAADITANGLSNAICKDGQTTVTADIPFANFRLKLVGDATLATDAPNLGQIQSGAGTYAVDTGTADVYAIAPSPAVAAYAVGQLFRWKVVHANTTTTPTLAVNGLTAGTIEFPNGSALVAGNLAAGSIVQTVVSDVTTGTPTFQLESGATPVTAAQANNSTQVATTAYVDRVAVQQVVSIITGTEATGTTILPLDNTIPQSTEGDEYMTLAITPKSATSKLIINVVLQASGNQVGANNISIALFQDSTADALAAQTQSIEEQFASANVHLNYEMTSGTTSATTFKVRAGPALAATLTFNGSASAGFFGGVMASSIIITEVGV